MGPVRGGLILSLLASPAWAEVCDKLHPGWDGAPATAVSEAIALFLSPIGLALLIATVIAIRFKSVWGGLAAVVCWTVFVTFVVQYDPGNLRQMAMAEGCVGEPTLFIVATIAICVVTILLTAPRDRGKT